MKNIYRSFRQSIVAIAFLGCLFSNAVLAQGDLGKIAVVNVQNAIMKSDYAQARLEESKQLPDVKDTLEKLESLDKELTGLIEQYKKDESVMSEEKRAEEQRRIRDRQTDGQYLTKKLLEVQKELEQRVVDEVGPRIGDVLKSIVKDEDISLLLRRETGAIVHADERYDITDKVTEKLNLLMK